MVLDCMYRLPFSNVSWDELLRSHQTTKQYISGSGLIAALRPDKMLERNLVDWPSIILLVSIKLKICLLKRGRSCLFDVSVDKWRMAEGTFHQSSAAVVRILCLRERQWHWLGIKSTRGCIQIYPLFVSIWTCVKCLLSRHAVLGGAAHERWKGRGVRRKVALQQKAY